MSAPRQFSAQVRVEQDLRERLNSFDEAGYSCKEEDFEDDFHRRLANNRRGGSTFSHSNGGNGSSSFHGSNHHHHHSSSSLGEATRNNHSMNTPQAAALPTPIPSSSFWRTSSNESMEPSFSSVSIRNNESAAMDSGNLNTPGGVRGNREDPVSVCSVFCCRM
jgi:hypothetical protein